MSFSNTFIYPDNNYKNYFYPEKVSNKFKTSLLHFKKKYKISK